MGNVNFGPDEARTLALRDQYHLRVFVETGTYKGNTTKWAVQHFERVFTIEGDRKRFEKTQADLGNARPSNATYIFGDSRHKLAGVLAAVHEPCLLWLDAHWNGGGAREAYELGDECPLREELEAVNASTVAARHVLMIDDARLFLAPPPYPHHPEQWLAYPEIEALLAPRRVYVLDDVIYAEPVDG